MGKRSRKRAPRTPASEPAPRTPASERPSAPERASARETPPDLVRAEPVISQEPPRRLVIVAFVLALVCALAPLAVLGAAFAGAVLYTRGRRAEGAGVIALAVICCALAFTVLQ